MLNSGGIYTITNTLNGKRYVGSAKCMKVRRSKHISALSLGKHHAKHLQAAVKLYGIDVFEFAPILLCAPEDLIFYEQRAIDHIQPEYNSSPTAGNTLGVKCSPERKKKISDAHKGKTLSNDHRAAIAAAGIGRKASPETKAKLLVVARAKAEDPEWRRKVKEGCIGRVFPADFGERIRKAKLGKPASLSEEGRLRKNAKIAEANRVRVITDEHRKNSRASQRSRANIERFLFGGELLTVLELSERFGVTRHTLRKRLNAGWDMNRALTQPTKQHVRS